jgi:hypothetical protein
VKTESFQSGLIGSSPARYSPFCFEIAVYGFINQRDQVSKLSKSAEISIRLQEHLRPEEHSQSLEYIQSLPNHFVSV